MSDTFDPYLSWLGIEPHERPLDHYRLLGLARFEDRREVILAAADQRMGYIRSFQAGPRGAHTQKLLNELATAKLCLLDAGARLAYDAALQARLFPPAPPPVPLQPMAAPVALPPPPPPAPQVPSLDFSSSQPANASANMEGVPAEPADDLPFYARPWLPLAFVGTVLLGIGLVLGVGKFLKTPAKVSGELADSGATPDESEVETPEGPETPPAEPTAPALIEQSDSGEIELPAAAATLHGSAELNSRGGEQVISNWRSEGDWVSWTFHVSKPGIFRASLSYAAPPTSAGGRYEISIGEERKASEIRTGSKPDQIVSDTVFIAIRKGGRHTLEVRAKQLQGQELFALKSVGLKLQAKGR